MLTSICNMESNCKRHLTNVYKLNSHIALLGPLCLCLFVCVCVYLYRLTISCFLHGCLSFCLCVCSKCDLCSFLKAH